MQSEIWMFGKLSHPNLIKLHGYCWHNGALFAVFEYMQKGSFKNHLFGSESFTILTVFASSKALIYHAVICVVVFFIFLGGSSIQPLQWDVRLKILIGAGRALAFFHALKKPVIYRDFKALS